MSTRNRLGSIVVTLIVAAFAAAAPSTALAGNNGQQVRLCTSSPHLAYGWVYVAGYNQNGTFTVSPFLRLGETSGGTYAAPGGCVELNGWWWIGDVSIYWFEPSSARHGTFFQRSTCNVPRWNPFTDHRRCDS